MKGIKTRDIFDAQFEGGPGIKNFFILFWLESEGLLDKFYENHLNCPVRGLYFDSTVPAEDLLRYVPWAFNWSESPEKHKFWNEVWDRMISDWEDMNDGR